MDIVTFVSTVTTVVSFVAFLGIVWWAWSKRRGPAFEEAANAPFALPDEAAGDGAVSLRNKPESRS